MQKSREVCCGSLAHQGTLTSKNTRLLTWFGKPAYVHGSDVVIYQQMEEITHSQLTVSLYNTLSHTLWFAMMPCIQLSLASLYIEITKARGTLSNELAASPFRWLSRLLHGLMANSHGLMASPPCSWLPLSMVRQESVANIQQISTLARILYPT